MKAKLSSKGQLIIPKAIRHTMALGAGAQFQIEIVNKKIILEPISKLSPVDFLYGKYAGTDLLRSLEKEHRQEIEDDHPLRP
jgi:AbrB family looped-hinge helix DNA binding protein